MPPLELPCSHVCLPVRAHTHSHSNQARKCPAPSDKTYSLIFFKLWLMISSWLQARTAEILGVQSSARHFMQSTTLLLQFPSTHVRWPAVRDIFARFPLMWCSHGEDFMCDSLAIFLLLQYQQPTRFSLNTPKRKIQVLPCGNSHSDNTSNGVSQRWQWEKFSVVMWTSFANLQLIIIFLILGFG